MIETYTTIAIIVVIVIVIFILFYRVTKYMKKPSSKDVDISLLRDKLEMCRRKLKSDDDMLLDIDIKRDIEKRKEDEDGPIIVSGTGEEKDKPVTQLTTKLSRRTYTLADDIIRDIKFKQGNLGRQVPESRYKQGFSIDELKARHRDRPVSY